MKFIKLTYADNTIVYVNTSHILAFEVSSTHPKHTDVVLVVGVSQVKETPEVIFNRINRAGTY